MFLGESFFLLFGNFSGLIFVIVRIYVCETFDQKGIKFFHYSVDESSTGA